MFDNQFSSTTQKKRPVTFSCLLKRIKYKSIKPLCYGSETPFCGTVLLCLPGDFWAASPSHGEQNESCAEATSVRPGLLTPSWAGAHPHKNIRHTAEPAGSLLIFLDCTCEYYFLMIDWEFFFLLLDYACNF